MTRSRLAAAVFAALLPASAEALSCAPVTAEGLYLRARDSETRYTIVHGAFRADGPPTNLPGEQGGQRWTGLLEGRALGRRRFDVPFRARIEWRATCVVTWCGSAPPEGAFIAFVAIDGPVPTVETAACGGGAIAATPANLRAVLRCHRGRGCDPGR
ncbi:MAG: hypothetical protein N2Z62_09705 [Rhodobacteraceae bacterium]|nr:hypothetical protein [Paracoccaceae bacterium]